jgi:hypothetical protein
MTGVVVAMLMSVGGAAAVLAVLARRNAPSEGWRGALQSAMHVGRDKDEAAEEPTTAEDEQASAGLDAIFEIGEAPDEPAYSEATAVQHVLERARQKSPTLARILPPSA